MAKVTVDKCAKCGKVYYSDLSGSCHVYHGGVSSYVSVKSRPYGMEDENIYDSDVCHSCCIEIMETAISILNQCDEQVYIDDIEAEDG